MRNKFNLPNWFTNLDYVEISFSDEVFWLKEPAHPAAGVTDKGGNVWRIDFSQLAMFTERTMDWTGELRSMGKADILYAETCQCN